MKGSVAAIDTLPDGRKIAALLVDGVLEDLIVDPPEHLGPVQPGALFRGVVERQIKGMGGVFVALGDGQSGFLRDAKGLAPGQTLLVQVTTAAEPGKAAPLTARILFKSRYAIITPGRAGLNLSRRIRDEEERVRLSDIAEDAMEGSDGLGLILRSCCVGADGESVASDIADMRDLATRIMADEDSDAPALLLEAPDATELAWREWVDPAPDEVRNRDGSFEELSLWDAIETAKGPREALGQGAWMSVEPTRALLAVDVNTGGDLSLAAGLKADIAALRALPRALRVRGLGGQIVIDLAPYPKKERKVLEQVLRAALKADPIETSFAGWTPLGNIELQRKRERRPLREVLP